MLDLREIEFNHTHKDDWRNFDRTGKMREYNFIQSLPEKLGHEKYVVLNCDITLAGHVPTMFFTNYLAYPWLASEADRNNLKANGYKIAIVDWGEIPKELRADKSIVFLPVEEYVH